MINQLEKYNWGAQFESEHVRKSLTFFFEIQSFLEQNNQIKNFDRLRRKISTFQIEHS